MRDFFLKLFNLDRVDFSASEGWRLRFHTEWAPLIVLLGCVALVVLAYPCAPCYHFV